ncbi:hypothetical protein MPSEU_000638000 [Mayamaea pseudoterrestris]|nr:hypothetical protein MPSEU_000638000 [Mayamaea pseudoterrestris]
MLHPRALKKYRRQARDVLIISFVVVLLIQANLKLDLRGATVSDAPPRPPASQSAVKRRTPRVRSLHLLGERHSGTTWIQNHLRECFNHSDILIRTGLHRWKHWFQEDGQYAGRKSMVVVMFRDPIQWIEAMHTVSHHAPKHYGLEWYDFVTKPWTMKYFGKDLKLTASDYQSNKSICQEQFTPKQVVPCLEEDFVSVTRSISMRPNYELRHDGSGEPYKSIVDLRRDKVLNFMSIAKFDGILDFEPVQYEQLVQNGTNALLRRLEKALGFEARCKPYPPKPLKLYKVQGKYLDWLKDKIDWDVESMIGYSPPSSSITSAE